MSEVSTFDVNSLTQLLPTYYRKLFPTKLYIKWLSYGDKEYFSKREWCFTLKDDVYLRYKSFRDASEVEKELVTLCPFKIDIGAVYTMRPKDQRNTPGFEARERELVFDIDLTDYDDIRKCCSGGTMCQKCWLFMVVAVNVIDVALRDDFGFKHILYVYSGRRGVHCWVCDESARSLSGQARGSIAEYLSVLAGGSSAKQKINIGDSRDPIHPSLRRSQSVINEYWSQLVEEQGWFDSQEEWELFVDSIELSRQDNKLASKDDEIISNHLKSRFPDLKGSADQRWKSLVHFLKQNISSQRELEHCILKIQLLYSYPRLDVNVTKGLNHLLKGPFCVHPKTGKVAVPFSLEKAQEFAYDNVPRLDALVSELQLSKDDKENADISGNQKRKILEYKHTTLSESIGVFESFLQGMSESAAAIKNRTLEDRSISENMDF